MCKINVLFALIVNVMPMWFT